MKRICAVLLLIFCALAAFSIDIGWIVADVHPAVREKVDSIDSKIAMIEMRLLDLQNELFDIQQTLRDIEDHLVLLENNQVDAKNARYKIAKEVGELMIRIHYNEEILDLLIGTRQQD